MGFGTLILVSLLVVNAAAILHEKRFLEPLNMNYRPDLRVEDSAKGKIIFLLKRSRDLRSVLIPLNIITVLYMLIWG